MRSSGKASGCRLCRWRNRVTAWTALSCASKGKQIGFPISCKRVRDGAAMRDRAIGWQRGIGVNAAGGAFAEPGTGGCGTLTLGLEV